MPAVALAEQIAEVRRELALRQRVYAKKIAAGDMLLATAELHMERMRAVLLTLERLNRETPCPPAPPSSPD